jgi:N-acetylglucosamine-6-phosphate deacetylase
MGAATARQPDMVGSALSLDETAASIIVDGHHVDPNMVTIAYRCKPKGKLFLVSDSMASVGGSPQFQLYGETLKEEGGRIVNQEGTLAGSAISLIDALRIAVKDCQIPLGDAISMATYYPAQFLGVENRVGLLKTGYRADLVHFDEEFQIKNIWKSGSIV